MSQNTKKTDRTPRRTAQRQDTAARGRASTGLVEDETLSQRIYYALLRFRHHTRRRWLGIKHAKREHHFPESDRFLIKLLLFVWGLLPVLGSLLHSAYRRLTRRAVRSAEKELAWVERHPTHPFIFLTAGCCAAGAALFLSVYTQGTTVTYDGTLLGSVASTAAVEEARTSLEALTSKTLGRTYRLKDELFTYETGWMKRQDLVEQAHIESTLSDHVGLVTNAYSLYVAGERIGSTPYKGALEELLNQLKSGVTTAETISVSFAEEVEIREEYVPTADIVNLGYLAELLYSTKMEEVTYEVKKGDTWSQIANNHGYTSAELLALNPGFNIHRLSIGDMITLSAAVPYLTMTVQQQERYVQDIQYDVAYTNDASMYQGDYKVTSKGVYGKADVVASVTYINGEETERTVLSSVTLREPVTEQQLRGTKERPTWYPTGTFRWPTTGRVTSYFGGRKSPGGIGSTNHKGMDIANSRGTPIYAADGGTVTYAGWMGGYGYTVKIKHNNGYETIYAHNSSLLVSAGAHVHKGQQIAKMGSTGNSTGSHCHFEIRLNGVPQNPLNYI